MKNRLYMAPVILFFVLLVGLASNDYRTIPGVKIVEEVYAFMPPEHEKKVISDISRSCFPFDEEGKRVALNLNHCSLHELSMGRNQIFAYYGYEFKDPELTKYFNQFSWYKPISDFDPKKMSEDDKRNLNKIQKQEKLLQQIPDKVIFYKYYTLYRPYTTDYTIAYSCINCKDATIYYDEAYLETRIAVIPGIKSSQEEILNAWNDAVFVIDTAGMDTYVHDDSIYSCMLKSELINEPHICVHFRTEGWYKHTLIIGWKEGVFNRIGDIPGAIIINNYTDDSNKQTEIFASSWKDHVFANRAYVYDHDKEIIEFLSDGWPVFVNLECEVGSDYEDIGNIKYFHKGEKVNITLVDCSSNCRFLITSHDRPALKEWVNFPPCPDLIPPSG